MSCRCCGSNPNQNGAAVESVSSSAGGNGCNRRCFGGSRTNGSASGGGQNADSCFWPEFAILPRNTTQPCGCSDGSPSSVSSSNGGSSNGGSSNDSSSSGSSGGGNGCGCRRRR